MNLFFRNIKYLLLILAVASAVTLSARTTVRANLDSTSLLMGILTDLNVEVVEDVSEKGHFPLFRDCPADGFVSLLGDSVELRAPRAADTVDLGSGKRQINFKIPLQSFDSGAYRLPELLYVAGRDTARSNVVAFKIYPVSVTAADSIAGFSPVLEPDGVSVFDNVPDFLIDFWWIIIAVIALAAIVLWLLKRYRKQGSIIPPKPQPSPYEVAKRRLSNLRARKLWEKGMEKEYFTDLTDILRVYLQDRFGINAMEMTSRQIMDSLVANPEIKDKREYMRQILNMADFVKFAKVRPLPDDNIAAIDNAERFVEETRPADKPEADSADEVNAGKEVKS